MFQELSDPTKRLALQILGIIGGAVCAGTQFYPLGCYFSMVGATSTLSALGWITLWAIIIQILTGFSSIVLASVTYKLHVRWRCYHLFAICLHGVAGLFFLIRSIVMSTSVFIFLGFASFAAGGAGLLCAFFMYTNDPYISQPVLPPSLPAPPPVSLIPLVTPAPQGQGGLQSPGAFPPDPYAPQVLGVQPGYAPPQLGFWPPAPASAPLPPPPPYAYTPQAAYGLAPPGQAPPLGQS